MSSQLQSIPRSRKAFTLVELLVSVVLVVLLLLGVNQVFKLSSDAVSAGNVVSTMTRENRSVQAVLQEDFRGVNLVDPALFIIASLGRGNPDNGQDVRYDSHLRFLRVGNHRRQTADDGSFTSGTQSLDAYVCYGLTRYNTINITDPAARFAQLRTLHRNVILLRNPQDMMSDGNTLDETMYVANPSLHRAMQPATATPLAPLTPDTVASQSSFSSTSGTGGQTVEYFTSSRFDIAGTTAEFYKSLVQSVMTNQYQENLSVAWWAPLLYSRPSNGRASFTHLTSPAQPMIYPFEVINRPRKPFDSEGVSKNSAVFVENVSSLVVEFAGDFVTQNTTVGDGRTTRNQPDGIVDFQWVPSPTDPTNTFYQRTRWYGAPRDISGPGPNFLPDGIVHPDFDVVPVRDVFINTGGQPPNGSMYRGQWVARFERKVPWPRFPYRYGPNGSGIDEWDYICIWSGPGNIPLSDQPKMLRVVIKVEDPSQRVAAGQSWEYVLTPP